MFRSVLAAEQFIEPGLLRLQIPVNADWFGLLSEGLSVEDAPWVLDAEAAGRFSAVHLLNGISCLTHLWGAAGDVMCDRRDDMNPVVRQHAGGQGLRQA